MIDPNALPNPEEVERLERRRVTATDHVGSIDIDSGGELTGAIAGGLESLASGLRGVVGRIVPRGGDESSEDTGGFSALAGAVGDMTGGVVNAVGHIAGGAAELAGTVLGSAGEVAGAVVEHAPDVLAGAAEIAGQAAEAVGEGLIEGLGDLLN